MRKSHILFSGFFLLLAFFPAKAYAADPLYLHLVVQDRDGNPKENISIKAKGAYSGAPVRTDAAGYCRIRLADDVEPGVEVELIIFFPKNIIIISPLNRTVRAPAPKLNVPAKSQQTINVDKKGEIDMDDVFLEDYLRLRARELSAKGKITPEMRKKFQKEQADRFGLSVEDFEKAISEYLKQQTDPYKKGMNAFHEGDYSEAVDYLMKWKSTRSKSVDEKDLDKTRKGLIALGKCLILQGEYKKAITPLESALNDDPKYIPFLNLLIDIHLMRGSYNSAFDLVKYMNPLIIGEKNPERAILFMQEAQVGEGSGWMKYSKSKYKKAYNIFKEVKGVDHIKTANVRLSLAHLYIREGSYKDASLILDDIMPILSKYPEQYPEYLLKAYQELALIHSAEGRHVNAVRMMQKSGDILKKSLPSKHPLNCIQESILARILIKAGNTAEGEKLLLESFKKMAKCLVAEHLEILANLRALALFYEKTGRWKDAHKIWINALIYQTRAMGSSGLRTFFLNNKMVNAAIRAGNPLSAKVGLASQLNAFSLPFRIGASGIPDRRLVDIARTVDLSFEGIRHLDEQILRDKIEKNIYVRKAKVLAGLLHDYSSTLASVVKSIYHENGFANVTVEPYLKNKMINLVIDEGKQYSIRKVIVIGDTVPDKFKTKFERKLGKIYTGKYATFSLENLDTAIKQTAALMAEKGYWFPEISAKFKKSGQDSFDLNIIINDMGPKGEIGEIKIKNVSKNPPIKVQRYIRENINIPDSSYYTDEIKKLIVKGLIDSARFAIVELTPHRPEPGKEWIELDLDLQDEESVPPLYEPLLPEQETLLKAVKWIENLAKHPEDVVSRFTFGSGNTAEIAFSPEKGLAALIELAPPEGQNKKLCTGFMLRPNKIGVVLKRQNVFCSLEKKPLKYIFSLNVGRTKLKPGEKKPEHPNELTFEVGVQKLEPGDPMIEFNVSIVPAAFLSILKEKDYKVTMKNGYTVYDFDDTVMTIDPKTGRINEITWKTFPVFSTQPGAFDSLIKKVDRTRGMEKISGFRPEIVAALIEWLSEDGIRILAESGLIENSQTDLKKWIPSAGVMLKLTGRAVTKYLAEFNAGSESDTLETDEPEIRTDILIPETVSERFIRSRHQNFLNLMVEKVIGYSLQQIHKRFEWGRWPCMFTHQALLIYLNDWFKLNDWFALAEATRIARTEEIGPLGLYAFAALYGLKKDPYAACTFALQGLMSMDAAFFHLDCEMLLKQKYMPGKIIHLILKEAGKLDEKEINSLIKPIPEVYHPAIQEIIKVLKEQDEYPLSYDRLKPALNNLWNQGLKNLMKKEFESIISASFKQIGEKPLAVQTYFSKSAAESCYQAGISWKLRKKYKEALICLRYAAALGYPGSNIRIEIHKLKKELDKRGNIR
ncbi:hypothetical protein ACFL6F_01755 [Planctomycetota bacterium]